MDATWLTLTVDEARVVKEHVPFLLVAVRVAVKPAAGHAVVLTGVHATVASPPTYTD
jgi:hypothetical protein